MFPVSSHFARQPGYDGGSPEQLLLLLGMFNPQLLMLLLMARAQQSQIGMNDQLDLGGRAITGNGPMLDEMLGRILGPRQDVADPDLFSRIGDRSRNQDPSRYQFVHKDDAEKVFAPGKFNEEAGGRPDAETGVRWISQFDRGVERYGDSACYRACRKMMAEAGVRIGATTANNIRVADGETSTGRVKTNENRTDAARAYIDQQLDARKPVTVGVSHKNGYAGNRDRITDHFVVINGRGTDENGRQYYTFHDPATEHRRIGENRRFYIDKTSGNLFHPTARAGSNYVIDKHKELSMVIRNE